MSNKRKIINDPVFGFINISTELIYDVIQHPYMQRLNRVRQLGLAAQVYPGAVHTRFLHSLGAMHLMGSAIAQLRLQGQEISEEEEEAAQLAILMHDIGHGPFSHVLEHTIVQEVTHEEISLLMMKRIDNELGGKLEMAIAIFKDKYHKHFLHQLVSSQLDVDRLDYLCRDSFFCGVSEGTVASARILKMLNVVDDRLVVESKGIYSIEKFLVARRFMYWQVYLHKTSVASEQMLLRILKRAKWLSSEGTNLFASPALHFFLYNDIKKEEFDTRNEVLLHFSNLDDSDIWSALKVWSTHSDVVLSTLCRQFVNRKLFKVERLVTKPSAEEQKALNASYSTALNISEDDAGYFWGIHTVTTDTYKAADDRINILYNNGEIKDISEASDMLNINVLTKKVEKYFFCYYKL